MKTLSVADNTVNTEKRYSTSVTSESMKIMAPCLGLRPEIPLYLVLASTLNTLDLSLHAHVPFLPYHLTTNF